MTELVEVLSNHDIDGLEKIIGLENEKEKKCTQWHACLLYSIKKLKWLLIIKACIVPLNIF